MKDQESGSGAPEGGPESDRHEWLESITRYVLSAAMAGMGLVAVKQDEVITCVFCFLGAILLWIRASLHDAR